MMAPVAVPVLESRDELIQHLEKLTGRTLKTREDIAAYVHEVKARSAADEPSVQRWLKAKKVMLVALFAFGVVQYYVLDVMLEIASMRSTTFFVPASTQTLKS
jgi:hypothetical protein